MTITEVLVRALANTPGILAATAAFVLVSTAAFAALPFLLLGRARRPGALLSFLCVLSGSIALTGTGLLLYGPVSVLVKSNGALPAFALPWTGGVGVFVFLYYLAFLRPASRLTPAFGTVFPVLLCALSGLGAAALCGLAVTPAKGNDWLILPAFLGQVTLCGISSSLIQRKGAIPAAGLLLMGIFYLFQVYFFHLAGVKVAGLPGLLFLSAAPVGLYSLLSVGLSRTENLVSAGLAGLTLPLTLLSLGINFSYTNMDAGIVPAVMPGVLIGFCLGYLWPAIRQSFARQTYWFAASAFLPLFGAAGFALLAAPWSLLNLCLAPVLFAAGLFLREWTKPDGRPAQALVLSIALGGLLAAGAGIWIKGRLGLVEMTWNGTKAAQPGQSMQAATSRTIELPLDAQVFVEPELTCGRGPIPEIGSIRAGARKATFEGRAIPENALSQEMTDFAAAIGARVVFDDSSGFSMIPPRSRKILLYNEDKKSFLLMELGEEGETLALVISKNLFPCSPGNLPASFRTNPAYLPGQHVEWLRHHEVRVVKENTDAREDGAARSAGIPIPKGMIVEVSARSGGRALTRDGWIDESSLTELSPSMDQSYYAPIREFLLEREFEQNERECHRHRVALTHGPGTRVWEYRHRLVEVPVEFGETLITRVGDVEVKPYPAGENRREIEEEIRRLKEFSARGSTFKIRAELRILFECSCGQVSCVPGHNVVLYQHSNDFQPAKIIEEQTAGLKTVFFSRPYMVAFQHAVAMCRSLKGRPPRPEEMEDLLSQNIVSRLEKDPGAFWTADCRNKECKDPRIIGRGNSGAVICISEAGE
jgi:hypothetical protein